MSYFDDNEDRIIYGRTAHLYDDFDEPREITCRYCGKGGLHWDDGILMEGRYKIHKCNEADVHAQAADDFEELE